MLPYFEQPVWHFGPLTVHAFGIAVAAAFWFGMAAFRWRLERKGLDARLGDRLGAWIFIGGVGGAHLFSVLLYFPDKLRGDPWLILRVWEDISSFGGVLGGAAGALLFFAIRANAAERRSQLEYLDSVAFVFPAALAIGRAGCALVHDHPGSTTAFPLAISLSTAAARAFYSSVSGTAGVLIPDPARPIGFHDLGLYECLYLGLVVVPLFAYWDRRRHAPGFFLAAFAALYLPIRFFFDTLRVADMRYVGLTPAQWVAALTLLTLPFAAVRRPPLRFAIAAAVVLMTVWGCAAGAP